ncbi:MAG: hypothetical protein C0483_18770 [Pirellula sp.]|nr:hypothetical protein [Pirellula sp.]
MDTVEKLERISLFISKLRRVVVVLILLAAAWITVDVYRKRNDPVPHLASATQEFTAESRGLKVHFRYPVDWNRDPGTSQGAATSAAFTPVDNEPGTHLLFAVVDGESATKLISNLPLIPPGATTVSKTEVDVGGHTLYRTEWHGEFGNASAYQHAACVEGAVGERFVSLRCITSASDGDAEAANQRFEKRREVLDDVLKSVRIEVEK